ncbi:MAG: FG-GAP-like repeat-containing protein [Chloroflexia bacterium]
MGDFNGDGHPDIAVANENSNNLTVLLGDGMGSFAPAPGSPFPVGHTPYGVAVGDLNSDGHPDLVVADEGSAGVSVLLGDGTGSFAPAPGSPFPVGTAPFAVAVADFNGDTRLDIAGADTGANSLTVLLNVCLLTPTAGATNTPANTTTSTATVPPSSSPTPTTPPAHTATPTATLTCSPGFDLVPSPNQGTAGTVLQAVAPRTPSDVWAVGFYYPSPGGGAQTLVEHWDGTAWTIVPSPSLSTNANVLLGVTALASNNAWAVGLSSDAGGTERTLIEHWDGTSWTIVPSPNVGTLSNNLNSVAVSAPNDIWATGGWTGSGVQVGHTLTEHWDGQTWTVVPSPSPGTIDNYLSSVSVAAPNDVWAVGRYLSARNFTLVEHWDGSAWTLMQGPDPGTAGDYFNSLSVHAANDIWAGGVFFNTGENNQHLLTAHWDGTAWTVVTDPDAGPGNAILGISAVGAADVWAVGGYADPTHQAGGSFAQHWDGTGWTVLPIVTPGTQGNSLRGVAALDSGHVWTVGDQVNNNILSSLIERYNNCPIPSSPTPSSTAPVPTTSPTPSSTATATAPVPTTSPVPSSTATATVPTPSPVPSATILATSTPAATPSLPPQASQTARPTSTSTPAPPATATTTACPINFSDVHPADYFYTPVQYLACHGVVSGYSDGMFRPYNNTTRSQMVKIVVLGFNKPITTPAGRAYSFTDVTTSNPFFSVVETAYADGIVSGYTCGTAPAGPCDSLRRPYFLPYNNVTRSQLAKIDVLAAGWTLYNPTTPSFGDVPVGSTFYSVIETAVCHGVVSGYNDGTFRPFNNATRGQISKIVYLSIVNPTVSCGP